MRALIIEDDPSVGRGTALILKARGHVCDLAESGVAGLELARAGRYDIILLDLSLPDMDGHKVLHELRAGHVRTPVLILSGSNDRQDKIKGLGIGADDYVTKPFDKEELLARIRAIVRRATGRLPPARAAVLDGALLAKRGTASAWGFNESYAPPSPGDAPVSGAKEKAGAAINLNAPTPQVRPLAAAEAAKTNHVKIDALGPARIIVLGNAKGGTGKSTVAMHLIVALLDAGHRVGSLDCDQPQGSLTRYLENRRRFAAKKTQGLAMPAHESLDAGALSSGRADRALSEQTKRNDFVVIDTPGHDTPLSRWAHGHADALITPINDSFVDLDALAEVEGEPCRLVGASHYSEGVKAARLERAAAGRPDIDWIVLRNRLANLDAQNRRRMAQILRRLSEVIGFREGPGLRERVIYRELFLSGLTLLDLPRDDAQVKFSMSHVAARQELRHLLEIVQPDVRPHRQGARETSRRAAQCESVGARPKKRASIS